MEQINAHSIFSPATGFVRRGGFGADTGEAARALLAARRWTEEDYRRCVELLCRERQIYEAEAGFFPPPAAVSSASDPDDYFSPQSHASRSDQRGNSS